MWSPSRFQQMTLSIPLSHQGLRISTVFRGVAREARPVALGRRAHLGLATPLPQIAHSKGAASRHASGVLVACLLADLLAVRREVLLGVLNLTIEYAICTMRYLPWPQRSLVERTGYENANHSPSLRDYKLEKNLL